MVYIHQPDSQRRNYILHSAYTVYRIHIWILYNFAGCFSCFFFSHDLLKHAENIMHIINFMNINNILAKASLSPIDINGSQHLNRISLVKLCLYVNSWYVLFVACKCVCLFGVGCFWRLKCNGKLCIWMISVKEIHVSTVLCWYLSEFAKMFDWKWNAVAVFLNFHDHKL